MANRNLNREMMEVVIHYLGGECLYCKDKKVQIHHILPVSKGGQNVLSNLELVCSKCHGLLHTQINKIMPSKRFLSRGCLNCGVVEERTRWFRNKSGVCGKCRKLKKFINLKK